MNTQALMQSSFAALVFGAGTIFLKFVPKNWQWVVAAAVLIMITPLALGGFWFSYNMWGISDWDYYFSLHTAWRDTILKHGQFPLWNPYICGGTAGLADPEFSVLTVTFPLELIFGVEQGLRLAIFLATAIGALGMLFLAKKLSLSPPAALLAALAFAFGSVNILEIVEGHVNIFSAMWIPWIFWAWLGAYRRQLRPLICGIFLALTFYQGGIYLLSYTTLAFLILPLLTAKPLHGWKVSVQSGLWALGLSAFKLIPVLFWLQQFPDKAYASSTYTAPYLIDIFFGRHLHGSEVLPNQGSGWHEYGAYIGIPIGLLALIGASGLLRHRIIRALVLAALISFLISSAGPLLKPFFDVAPFLPRSNISRLVLFTVISLSLLAAFGFDRLRQIRWVGTPLAYVLMILAAIDLLTFSYVLSTQAFIVPPAIPLPSPAPSPLAFTTLTYPTRIHGVDYTRAYAATKSGYGTLNYCSSLGPTPNVRTIHDEEDNYIVSLSPKSGQIHHLNWSPNKVHIQGPVTENSLLILNNNYAPGWYVNNQPAKEVSGRPAVNLIVGQFDTTFRYHPRGLYLGAVITIMTLAIAVSLSFYNRPRTDV